VAEPGVATVACGASAAATLAAAQPVLAVAPVRRALVVDDDPEVRRALARFLRPELDVSLAGSVSDAKAIVAQLDRLDVAFVDWELPDGTGEQILEWLSRWPDAIRVLISARFASSAHSEHSPPSSGPSINQLGEASTLGPGTPSEWPHEWSRPSPPDKPVRRSSDELPKSHSPSSDLLKAGSNPLKDRALANLVLGKPVATSVIEALKRAALALPND